MNVNQPFRPIGQSDSASTWGDSPRPTAGTQRKVLLGGYKEVKVDTNPPSEQGLGVRRGSEIREKSLSREASPVEVSSGLKNRGTPAPSPQTSSWRQGIKSTHVKKNTTLRLKPVEKKEHLEDSLDRFSGVDSPLHKDAGEARKIINAKIEAGMDELFAWSQKAQPNDSLPEELEKEKAELLAVIDHPALTDGARETAKTRLTHVSNPEWAQARKLLDAAPQELLSLTQDISKLATRTGEVSTGKLKRDLRRLDAQLKQVSSVMLKQPVDMDAFGEVNVLRGQLQPLMRLVSTRGFFGKRKQIRKKAQQWVKDNHSLDKPYNTIHRLQKQMVAYGSGSSNDVNAMQAQLEQLERELNLAGDKARPEARLFLSDVKTLIDQESPSTKQVLELGQAATPTTSQSISQAAGAVYPKIFGNNAWRFPQEDNSEFRGGQAQLNHLGRVLKLRDPEHAAQIEQGVDLGNQLAEKMLHREKFKKFKSGDEIASGEHLKNGVKELGGKVEALELIDEFKQELLELKTQFHPDNPEYKRAKGEEGPVTTPIGNSIQGAGISVASKLLVEGAEQALNGCLMHLDKITEEIGKYEW